MKKSRSNLKYILLIKNNQSEKIIRCMIPTLLLSGKGKNMKAVKRSSVVREERRMNRKSTEDFRAVKLFCII